MNIFIISSSVVILMFASVILTAKYVKMRMLIKELERGVKIPNIAPIRLQYESELQEKLCKKREKYINLPFVSFHYANKERIKSMYDEYFPEPRITNITNETVNSKSKKVKGKVRDIIGVEFGGNNIDKSTRNIKLPETNISGMIRKCQSEAIEKKQIDLTLEMIEAELFIIDEFDDKIKELKEKYNFDIENTLIVNHRNKLQEIACKKTIEKLERAKELVLIEGNFSIEKEGNNYYKLVLAHPVNSYIEKENRISISCLIQTEEIESGFSGNYANSIGSEIPLKVYGEVWKPINAGKKDYELTITPLAVY